MTSPSRRPSQQTPRHRDRIRRRLGWAGVATTALVATILPDAFAAADDESPALDAVQREWALHAAFNARSVPAPATSRLLLAAMPVRQLALVTDLLYRDPTLSGDHLLVVGSRSALSGNNSVGYGNLITTVGDNIVAVGHNVKAINGGYSTAVGANAIANGLGATVVGNGAQANVQNAVAVGSGAITHGGTGIARIAIGGGAYAGTGGWTGAIAVGGSANASHDSIAIGYQARTTASGAIALGPGSLASEADTVSVGNAGTHSKRRIVNIEDARLGAGSSDAVTGGQLYMTNARVLAIEQGNSYVSIGADPLSKRAEASLFGVAVGDSATASPASEGGTAVGAFASANARNSVAVGRGSYVEGGAESGFALGVGSRVAGSDAVALGAYSKVEAGAANALALGAYSVASDAGTVSFGHAGLQRRLVNLARGMNHHDAVTFAQLDESLTTLGGGAGLDANGTIVAPIYTLQGGTQNSVGDALAVLDGAVSRAGSRVGSIESELRSVFQGSPSVRADGLGYLNLAGANGMVLGNLADGRVAVGSRDAVNGGQLHDMKQQLDGRMDGLQQRIEAPAPRALSSALDDPPEATAPPPAAMPPADPPATVDTRQLDELLERASQYTDQATAGIERRLDRMDKRYNRMAAMSSAQSAMAMNTAGLATYNRLGVGIGHADGEAAMAVGYQRVLNAQGSSTVSLHGAFTNSGERGVGLGVGIGW